MDLNSVWFVLLGAMFIAYAVLDGIDLGVGIILPAFKSDAERRAVLGAIGPLWDGNEIWLLAAFSASAAAFPRVFDGVFGGLHALLLALFAALIFRVAARGLRKFCTRSAWRKACDGVFCAASVLVAFLLGFFAGNCVTGMPVDADGNVAAGTLGLLDLVEPIPLFSGVLAAAIFAFYGALFLRLRTTELARFRVEFLMPKLFAFVTIFYIVLTLFVIFTNAPLPAGTANFSEFEALGLVPAAAILSLVATGVFLRCRTVKLPIVATGATIALLVLTVGVGMFPALVPATNGEEFSLTVRDAAPTGTLCRLLVVAAVGAPLIAVCQWLVHRAFAKKSAREANSAIE